MISAVAPLRPNNSDFHSNGAELTTGKRREKGKESNKHFEPVLVCCGFFLTVR